MRRKQIKSENLRANILGSHLPKCTSWTLQGRVRESSALLYNDKFMESLKDTPRDDETFTLLINPARGL
jgi:hypothetical protein